MIDRKFFRYRLRTLLLGTFLLSALLTWLTGLSWRQYMAVRKVESLGGQVTYGESSEGWFAPYMPSLLKTVTEVQLGGLHLSENLDQLCSINTQATDKDISRLIAAFPDVERLNLESTLVTDNLVEILGASQKLRRVNLCSTRVTEKGLNRLRLCLPKCDAFIHPQIIEFKGTSDFNFPDDYYLDLIAE